MIELLSAFIIGQCGSIDNTECVDFYLNCTVDKQGKISETNLQECKTRFNKGERYIYVDVKETSL